MGNTLKFFSLLVVGFVLGWLSASFDRISAVQEGYTEGRDSILESTIKLGNNESPCSVSIPLGVLSEMISAGVFEWHKVCENEHNEQ